MFVVDLKWKLLSPDMCCAILFLGPWHQNCTKMNIAILDNIMTSRKHTIIKCFILITTQILWLLAFLQNSMAFPALENENKKNFITFPGYGEPCLMEPGCLIQYSAKRYQRFDGCLSQCLQKLAWQVANSSTWWPTNPRILQHDSKHTTTLRSWAAKEQQSSTLAAALLDDIQHSKQNQVAKVMPGVWTFGMVCWRWYKVAV